MPSLEKDGTYKGRLRLSGCPQKVKRGFKTWKAAKKWEIEQEEELKNPTPQETIPLTFSQASQKYLENNAKHTEQNTFRYKAHIIRSAITFWGEDPLLKDCDENMIEGFLDFVFENKVGKKGPRKTDGGKTANRYLKELQALFKWQVRKKNCVEDPTVGIKEYKEKPFKKYVPPAEDLYAVQAVASTEELDRIRCIYHSGARSGELRRMTIEDVNLITGNLTLWTRKRKGGSLEGDEIEMNQPLLELMERRIKAMCPDCRYVFPSPEDPRQQLSKYTLDNMMPRLCKKAGVKPFGLHAIRHHVAAQMIHSREVDLFDIQKFLRHKRMSTTDQYLKSLGVIKTKGASVLERIENTMKKRGNLK